MKLFNCVVVLILATVALPSPAVAQSSRLNLLIITVDDMSADSLGAFGCKLADTSPHVDQLAAESLRFTMAHVQVGNCMPSRNVMWSGRYPHNNGVEGFYQVKNPVYPVLCDLMKQAGYLTAIRHKVSHSTPYSPYNWDINLDVASDGSRPHTKDVASYGVSTRQGIDAAREQNKPFCLIINIADPHKPFFAEGNRGQTIADPHVPSRTFTAEEVPVPGFLFDDPVVRRELAHYYSSVRRADDAVGHILAALQASGQADNTLVMFLSDHGMPLPFAKTQLYHHSTHTPLMIRWPGVTRPGHVDDQHMVSAVDFTPTLLDIFGIDHPAGIDGRSFAPLLQGKSQSDRDVVFKEYNENAGGSRDPMRAVQTPHYLYVFNPWSNGERVMATATSGTSTYRRMAELAQVDDAIRFRHDLYQHRTLEELFDVQQDPDCLHNLLDSPEHQAVASRLRGQLENWMTLTKDPMLPVFQQRHDARFREAYILRKEAEAAARRVSSRSGNGKGSPNAGGKASRKKAAVATKQAPGGHQDLISLNLPASATAGQPFVIRVEHHLTTAHTDQLLQVTIKQGSLQTRLERRVVTISGEGVAEIHFDLPAAITDNQISIAAFVGEEFQKNLQHVQSQSIAVTERQK